MFSQPCLSVSTEIIITPVCSHMAFPDPSSLCVPCMVLSGLLVGMCKLPVTLFSAICECCADCHGYLIGSAWLVKFIVLSQEGLSLGLLVLVLKHAEVKGCDKLFCKPVGAGSPEAQCSTLMTTSLVSHFYYMILFLSVGFHYCSSRQIPRWLSRVNFRQPQLSVTSSKGSPPLHQCSNSLFLCSLHI